MTPFARRELVLYVSVVIVTTVATVIALELWRMTPSVPLSYGQDALQVAGYLDAVRETGWYEVQPALGAPFGQVLHDFPIADNLHLAIVGLLSLVLPKLGYAMNAYFLIGFPLAAVTATWFFRSVGSARWLAGALAVTFALAPYHFWRGENHYFLAAYWPVPLFAVLVVRVLLGRGLWNRGGHPNPIRARLTWQNGATLAILLIAGSATQYYAIFDLIILAIAAIMAVTRHRAWARFGGAVVAGGIVAIALLANMLPDFIYTATHAPSYGAADRPAEHSEWFALKVVMLLLPAYTHRSELFRALTSEYNLNFDVFTMSSLGLVAGAGLLLLFGFVTASTMRYASGRRGVIAPQPRRGLGASLGAIAVWILIIASSGGLAVFVALLVTTKIRGWDRLTIYLALLSLAAVAIGVHLVVRWMRRRLDGRASAARRWQRFGIPAISVLLLLVAFWDQTSPQIVPNYDQNGAKFQEDATYVAGLEEVLHDQAMVYQLPYQPYPEGPYQVFEMFDYDHLRLSLHSSDLRWSYGGVKGRPSADWPLALATAPTLDMVKAVTAAGFSGISIDRQGYGDHAAALEAELSDLLGERPIVSAGGTYSFWSLVGFREQLIEELGQDEFDALGYGTLHPALVYGSSPGMEYHGLSAGGQAWTVTDEVAEFHLVSENPNPITLRVSFFVGNTAGLTSLTIVMPDGSSRTVPLDADGAGVTRTVVVEPGDSTIKLVAEGVGAPSYTITNFQSFVQ